MNKEHTEYLFNTYPEFFKHKDDMNRSLMIFGFECKDGWFDLINNLCNDIKEWFMNNESNHIIDDDWNFEKRVGIPSHFEVHQVKEKFGGLRFYIGPALPVIHDMIHKAEAASFFICESCGDDIRKRNYNDGKYHSYYRDELAWIQTLCDSCLKKEIKRMNLRDSDYISDWQKEHNAPFLEAKNEKEKST